MATCPKCHTVNEEGLTRCRACNAIMPVKIGSKAEVRYERVRRQADLVGIRCPSCGTPNPYTLFRCQKCGSPLERPQAGRGLAKVWVGLGIGVIVLAVVLAIVMRAM